MRVVCCEEGHFFDYEREQICPICRRRQEKEKFDQSRNLEWSESYFRDRYGIILRESQGSRKDSNASTSDFVRDYSKQFMDFWSWNLYYSYEYIRYGGDFYWERTIPFLSSDSPSYIGNLGVKYEVGISLIDIVEDIWDGKYVSYEFIVLTEDSRCEELHICIDGADKMLRLCATVRYNSFEKIPNEDLYERIAVQNNHNNLGFFVYDGQKITYRYNCPIYKKFDDIEFDRLLKVIIGEAISGADYIFSYWKEKGGGRTKET